MVVICPRCGKEIEPVRKVGWRWFALWLSLGMIPALIGRWFALWLLFGMIPALIYVFYHFTKVPKSCLFCGYRDVYDEGKQLEEDKRKQLKNTFKDKRSKDKIKQLKKRLIDLDYELEHHIHTETDKERFTQEIHEVTEELRKYGYKGVVQKIKGISLKERKY